MRMSTDYISSRECIVLFAYLYHFKTMKDKQLSKEQHTKTEKPHRPEPMRNRSKKNRQTLDELLSKMTDHKTYCEAVKAGKLIPHRPEPMRNRSKKNRQTLDELLSKMTDDNGHAEVDFGPDVGSEKWWK